MLTDAQLNEIFRYSFSLIDSRMTPNQQAFTRAIEAAATAPLLERIAALDRKSDQDDESILFQAGEISKHLDRIAELEAKLAQRVPDEAIRSTLGYIAAYDPEELDAMPKGRLLQRTRAIINVARNTLSAAPAAPEQQEPVIRDSVKLSCPLCEESWYEFADGAIAQAPNAQQAEAQPVAIRYRFHYPDDGSTPYRVGDWRYTQGPWDPVPDTARDVGPLYTAQPKAVPLTKQMQRLSMEELEAIFQCGGDVYTNVQSALAAKNGMELAEAQQPCGHFLQSDAGRWVQCKGAASYTVPLYTAQPKATPLTKTQKAELVVAWFAEDWAQEKALGLLDDYDTAQKDPK